MLREGWHFIDPVRRAGGRPAQVQLEAEYAALLATALLILLALVVPLQGQAPDAPASVLGACVSAGGAVVDIIAITAIAGILIGAMNLTGVAFSLTQQLLADQRRQPARCCC